MTPKQFHSQCESFWMRQGFDPKTAERRALWWDCCQAWTFDDSWNDEKLSFVREFEPSFKPGDERNLIHDIDDLAAHFGSTPNRLKRDIYKFTDCGAWLEHDKDSVTIGSIVEGSGAEFHETMFYPFYPAEFDAWLDELETLCDGAWREANEEEVC